MKRMMTFAVCICTAAIAAQSLAQQPTHTPTTTPTAKPAAKAAAPETTAPVTPATAGAPSATVAVKSLYDRVGGEKTIAAVVSDFIDLAQKDPKVNFARKGTPREWNPTPENVAALKHSVTQYLCMATGGPQKYDGKDLKTAHQGMQITATEFDAMSADFAAALDHAKVAHPEHDDLMKIVAGTKALIVESAAGPTIKPTSVTTPTGSKK